MRIGVPKEIKSGERRVALTPEGALLLTQAGHRVVVERGAGRGAGFSDDAYQTAGAALGSAEDAWDSELVIKVKEPLPPEYPYLQQQVLFTFLHLAGAPKALTETLLARGTTAIAYETLEDVHGRLPILTPMSAMAGRAAALFGAYHLASFSSGKGVMLGEINGQCYGQVLILGDGVVARHAAKSACGLGARVAMAGLDLALGARIREEISPTIDYFLSNPAAIAARLPDADCVIGAVLVKGAKAPYVVSADMVRTMTPGSVIIDVSIDQGGCVETSEPTTHDQPILIKHGVLHYAVPNMPGAFARTATLALTRVTLPYVLQWAKEGWRSCLADFHTARGLNTHAGHLYCRPVAEALDLLEVYRPIDTL